MSLLLGMLGIAPAEQGVPDRWARGGELLSAAGPLAAARGIRAFHGSPHDFDKFSLSKIGTGEGAQAYGHGLYFAEKEGVARNYRDQLAGRVDWTGAGNRNYGSIDTAYVGAARNFKDNGYTPEQTLEGLRSAFKGADDRDLQIAIQMADPGRMYEVNIKADPDTLLDWDRPLSQQSDQVLSALGYHNKPRDFAAEAQAAPGTPEYRALERHMDTRVGSAAVQDVTGQEFYRSDVLRSTAEDERALSEYLRSKGIPGLKYLDGGSRTAGEGSRNYVIFDDSLIDILRKYGLLPAAVGAGAMMGGRSAPADQ